MTNTDASADAARKRRRYLRGGLALALLVVLAAVYQFWRIEAVFESEPEGAVVRIDGRALGLTPLTTDLSPGRHRVEYRHSHYQPEVFFLEVARGDRIRKRVTMRSGVGRLTLLSNPRGAWVELDGARQEGTTPLEVTWPTGPVTVHMGVTEHRVAEKQVIVLADETLTVNLDLDMDPHGSLTVYVSPEDARVSLPELDQTYRPGVRLPMGEQLIRVTRPGYETQEIRFDIRYGENLTRVDLTRAQGALRVRTVPGDAKVTVRYEKYPGRTVTETWKPGLRLPVGRLEVSARALGYRTGYRGLTLGRDGATVDLRLQPMNVKAGETFRDPLAGGGEGPLMVVLPPGTFVMGEPDGPPSVQPARERILSQPFAASVNEVSVADYRRFADDTGAWMDRRLTVPGEPVRYVKWSEAVAYTDWLTAQTKQKYRLPTEAEWEYLARGGTTSEYWFGDAVEDICRYANLADQSTRKIYRDWLVVGCDDGFAKVAPVGSFPGNAFGVRDVHGNVSEWVLECGMPSYADAPEDGSVVHTGQSCTTHGVRGGSWDSQPEALRSARRDFGEGRRDDRGIRIIKEL